MNSTIENTLKIFNLKDKLEYLNEVAELEYEEWADNKNQNKQERINTLVCNNVCKKRI